MCIVKLCYILTKRLGLFAMRLPSLSWGNGLGLWHNFGYFYPCFAQVYFLFALFFFATIQQKRKCTDDDLIDGYNVAHLQYKTIQNIDRIV